MRKRGMTRREFERTLEEVRARIHGEVKPFEDMSPEAVSARKAKAAKSLQAFGETYLPHYFTDPPAPWHRELDGTIAGLKRQLAAVHAHREGAKTSRYSIGFNLQQLLVEDGEPFILLISATLDIASDFGAFIKMELDDNPRIRADFGEMATTIWSSKDMVLANGRRLRALGAGQRMRGALWRQNKPTMVVLDDLEDDELAMNPKRVLKLYDWLFATLVPMMNKKRWRGVLLGTTICKGSFLDTVQTDAVEDERPVVVRKYPAVLKGPDGRERSSWPGRFSLEDWREFKKSVGTKIWMSEFQGEPTDEDATIRREWIDDNLWREGDLEGVELEAAACGYDPIPGKAHDEGEAKKKKKAEERKKGPAKRGSFAAVIKAARCPEGHLWVLEAWIKRRTVKRQVKALVDQYIEEPRPGRVRVETGVFASLVINELNREEVARKVRLPVNEVTQTKNKELRLASLQPLFERGLVHLNLAQGDQALLREQLIHMDNPNVEDDGPDALEMAFRELEGYVKPAGASKVPTRNQRRPGRKGRLFGRRLEDLYDHEPEEEEEKEEVAA